MWSVTASLFLPEVGFTKTPTYSLKEIVESLFLEKKSGGGKTGVFPPPSGEIWGCGEICPGLLKTNPLLKKLCDVHNIGDIIFREKDISFVQ